MPWSWTTGRRAYGGLVAIAVSAALAACAGDQYPQTTFRPVTDFGEALNRVFANTFWWTMAIFVVVLALIAYVMIRFRERPGQPRPRQIHGSTKLELLWTTIPAIIVVFIAVPTVDTIFSTQRRAPAEALLVEVVGHQWWWEFRYPELGVVTANQLVLPVSREVHLRMHSADVIHSFWIPRLGGKRDVNPPPAAAEGERHAPNHLLFTANDTGTYRGQCAEFCGASHAIMAMAARVVPAAEFDAWIASMREMRALPPAQTTDTAQAAAPVPATPDTSQAGATAAPLQAADPLAEEGKRIFLAGPCIACHAISNTSAKGLLGPNLTRFATRPTVGAGALPNTQDNVERWIKHPRSVKAGALMPGTREGAPPPGNPGGAPFPATGLTDEQVRAVAAYLMSLK
jgi:cytochrome c oxidase subunit 2